MKRVLIIGGYGHFGKFISEQLSQSDNIHLIIAGRTLNKAEALAKTFPRAEAQYLDIHDHFSEALRTINPDIVIHTSGPYQGQNYHVATACIEHHCHYIDLADARDFVSNIHILDKDAQKAKQLICSGASSVPCLTSAAIDHYKSDFQHLKEIHYSISTAQQTNLGLATLKSVLGYAGKPFKTLVAGKEKIIYGNMDQDYVPNTRRFVGNCDVPDLDIFPKLYPDLETLHFKAGTELRIVQYMLCLLSYGVRWKILPSLVPFAPLMLKISHYLNYFGSKTSYFTLKMIGTDKEGNIKNKIFTLKADHGDGLYIPCIPSILLTKKLVNNDINQIGATPCTGLITLDEYLSELKGLNISWDYI